MAELLYRLGRFSARRAWIVICSWVVVLGLAIGGFVIGFGGLSNSFDIPGTASGAVTDELAEKLPDFAGAAGTAVFTTTDGSAISDEQQKHVSSLVAGAERLPDVAKVIDPFATEQQRADQQKQLSDGQAQLADGRKQIDDGQAQLDAGTQQLTDAQAQLDAAKQQASAAGAPTDQIDAQQQLLDAQKSQLAAQQATLDDSRTQLEDKATQADLGAQLMSLSDGIRVVSADGSTALMNIGFTVSRLELSDAAKAAVVDYFAEHPVAGVHTYLSTEISQAVPSPFGVGEAAGLVFAAIVLLVMLGGILAAAMPIVTALVG